jgi:hypothetical protein
MLNNSLWCQIPERDCFKKRKAEVLQTCTYQEIKHHMTSILLCKQDATQAVSYAKPQVQRFAALTQAKAVHYWHDVVLGFPLLSTVH